jgi:hypothetical protein
MNTDHKKNEDSINNDILVQRLYQRLFLHFETVAVDCSSPFIVIADSLLLDILTNPALDWQHHGQFLHVFYILECLFDKLKQRGYAVFMQMILYLFLSILL